MADHPGDDEFIEYATARLPWLRKVAFLLSADWHRADDLVQTALIKLYANWHRASRVENVDGYTRTVLVNIFLAEQRTPWRRRVLLVSTDPETSAPGPDLDAVLDLRTALAGLPTKQRAAVVLRYYCDLPVAEVARTLGCSEGTVKSQTSRGIDTLRRHLISLPTRPYSAGPYEEHMP